MHELSPLDLELAIVDDGFEQFRGQRDHEHAYRWVIFWTQLLGHCLDRQTLVGYIFIYLQEIVVSCFQNDRLVFLNLS